MSQIIGVEGGMHDDNASLLRNVCKLTKQMLRLGITVACAISTQTCIGTGVLYDSLTAKIVLALIYTAQLCHCHGLGWTGH